MALETLKGIKEIGDYELAHWPAEETPLELTNKSGYLFVNHEKGTIQFKLQDGPIKEHGVNGCQVETLIHTALLIIKGLNAKTPCVENGNAINKLEMALRWLNERTHDRKERGVEGTSQA
jgi:hypothetical protein